MQYHTSEHSVLLTPLYRQLGQLAAQYGAKKLVLFGSRARGDCRQDSDIDLAVYGMPEKNCALFRLDAEELPTLLKLDIVHIRPDMDMRFLNNIERDGVLLMGKFEEKYTKLQAAVDRLKEALNEYESTPTSTVRDGVIQRFEFCTELAWKTLREYLLDQGYTEINSPKATIRQGFVEGAITDEAWLSLLDDRNLTAHVYDDKTAAAIFQRIHTQYLFMFTALINYLQN